MKEYLFPLQTQWNVIKKPFEDIKAGSLEKERQQLEIEEQEQLEDEIKEEQLQIEDDQTTQPTTEIEESNLIVEPSLVEECIIEQEADEAN